MSRHVEAQLVLEERGLFFYLLTKEWAYLIGHAINKKIIDTIIITECLNQMKVKLFYNGEPVASTLALVPGEMKHAGELMV